MKKFQVIVGVCHALLTAVTLHAQCQQWQPFNSELNNTVHALTESSNGDLIAGGSFDYSGPMVVNGVARWTGTEWQPLGAGIGEGHVWSLLSLPNGDILAGGALFAQADASFHGIARWNGIAWSLIGDGLPMFAVRALLKLSNGDILAGGDGGVYRWNGTTWTALPPLPGSTYALAEGKDGQIFAGGNFFNPNARLVRLNGNTWSAVTGGGLGSNPVYALAVMHNGDLVVGGLFRPSSLSNTRNFVQRWNGNTWSAFGTGIPDVGGVFSMIVLPNGNLIVGTYSTARMWNGTTWTQIGTRFETEYGYAIRCLAASSTRGLVVGGDFVSTTCSYISSWSDSPIIYSNPSDAALCATKSIQLSAGASGVGNQYQWRINGTNIEAATSATLVINNATMADTGAYDCIVSNSCGSVTTDTAQVIVRLPQIVSQPKSANVGVDQPVAFAVETNTASPCDSTLVYQWQRRNPLVLDDAAPDAWIELVSGGGFVGVNAPSLIILRPTPGLATGYRCRISNACGCEADSSGVIHTDVVNYSAACPSDFNLDGSVDGDDVIMFFERWDIGC